MAKTIITRATTPSGIARAYIAQHGCQFSTGFGRSSGASRDARAVHLDGDEDDTVSVLANSGTRRNPRGVVVLARGCRVVRP